MDLTKTRSKSRWLNVRIISVYLLLIVSLVSLSCVAIAQVPISPQQQQETVSSAQGMSAHAFWISLTAIPVIAMSFGYSLLQASYSRRPVNKILQQNLAIVAVAVVAFWAIGFDWMFGDGNPWFGRVGFFLTGVDNSPAVNDAYSGVYGSLSWANAPLLVKFFFSVANVVVAVSLIASAMVGRVRRSALLVFTAIFVGIIYPIPGHWIWGGGWLASFGLWDFAGSTVIFSVAAWAALTGAWLLDRRENADYIRLRPDTTLTIWGGVILCVGWLALNTGSTWEFYPPSIAHIAITTIAAAIGGAIGAAITSWLYFNKQDSRRIIQGILAGLIAISASCLFAEITWAAEIGFIASILAFLAINWFSKRSNADPTGLIVIHLVSGIWGTLALGLFSRAEPDSFFPNGFFFGGGVQPFWNQLIGAIAVATITAVLSWLVWLTIKATVGLESPSKG